MESARCHSAVVAMPECILVIGGCVGIQWTRKVELLHIKTLKWYLMSNLPNSCSFISATKIGNIIYVVGGSRGYYCTLPSLKAIESGSSGPTMKMPTKYLVNKWETLPTLPVRLSSIATIAGELVIVGGDHQDSSAPFIYQLLNQQWVGVACSVRYPRWATLLVSRSPDSLMIVGGFGRKGIIYDDAEEVVKKD